MNGEQTIPELEERIVFLTMERRAAMEALEVALDISSFTASLTGIESVEEILRESAVKIRALLPFEALAFFLADEDDDMALAPAYADPPEKMHVIEQEKNRLSTTAPSRGRFAERNRSSLQRKTAPAEFSFMLSPRPREYSASLSGFSGRKKKHNKRLPTPTFSPSSCRQHPA